MSEAFTEAGFRLAVISEPLLSPNTPRQLLPPNLGTRTGFLGFISSSLKRLKATSQHG
jgi:hypothetical protein